MHIIIWQIEQASSEQSPERWLPDWYCRLPAVLDHGQGLTVFEVAGGHLAGCLVIAVGLVHPAAALGDIAPKEVPLGAAVRDTFEHPVRRVEVAGVNDLANFCKLGVV